MISNTNPTIKTRSNILSAAAIVFAAVTFASCGENEPPAMYSVTVLDDGNGTATANPTKAASMTEVTLTATPAEGYLFEKWDNFSSGTALSLHERDNPATFTISGDVTVKAIFMLDAINGRVWAASNVDKPGTFAAKPEDFGMLYQWSRRVGWSATGPPVNSYDDSKWVGSDDAIRYYYAWRPEHDPCPEGWRMPTYSDFSSLVGGWISWTWTTFNGVTGRRFTDNYTGTSVFFPAVGVRSGSEGAVKGQGTEGRYWSSSTYETNSTSEFYSAVGVLDFTADYDTARWSARPDDALPIRCVKK